MSLLLGSDHFCEWGSHNPPNPSVCIRQCAWSQFQLNGCVFKAGSRLIRSEMPHLGGAGSPGRTLFYSVLIVGFEAHSLEIRPVCVCVGTSGVDASIVSEQGLIAFFPPGTQVSNIDTRQRRRA
jgi:hypothetical protein